MSSSPFIVAEVSANHNGRLDRALRIIHQAADAGADAVKFQCWTPGTMCVDKSYTLGRGPWKGMNLFDLYEEAYTPWEWFPQMFEYARWRGIEPFAAAFDVQAVDYLESLGVKRHKVASFELTDLPLIRYMASKGKPMILSAGMAKLSEMASASAACLAVYVPVTLLHCTSAYPAAPEDANLEGMGFAGRLQNCAWGLSDHSIGIGVACAAAALGATYIEKHLTLSRADGGLDAGFSMEPAEFAQLVTECRRAAAAIGEVRYGPTPGESTELRRSLWVVRDVAEGEPVMFGVNVKTARPALGDAPSTDLTGTVFNRPVSAGTPFVRKEMCS